MDPVRGGADVAHAIDRDHVVLVVAVHETKIHVRRALEQEPREVAGHELSDVGEQIVVVEQVTGDVGVCYWLPSRCHIGSSRHRRDQDGCRRDFVVNRHRDLIGSDVAVQILRLEAHGQQRPLSAAERFEAGEYPRCDLSRGTPDQREGGRRLAVTHEHAVLAEVIRACRGALDVDQVGHHTVVRRRLDLRGRRREVHRDAGFVRRRTLQTTGVDHRHGVSMRAVDQVHFQIAVGGNRGRREPATTAVHVVTGRRELVADAPGQARVSAILQGGRQIRRRYRRIGVDHDRREPLRALSRCIDHNQPERVDAIERQRRQVEQRAVGHRRFERRQGRELECGGRGTLGYLEGRRREVRIGGIAANLLSTADPAAVRGLPDRRHRWRVIDGHLDADLRRGAGPVGGHQ